MATTTMAYGTTGAAAYSAMPATMTTMAAPVTTAYTAPSSIAAPAAVAPMTTMAAAPVMGAYSAMPTTTMAAAAPISQTYAMDPMMAAAAYAMPAMPAAYAAPAMPMQPMRLTEGMPNTEQIASQKAAYAKALDQQLGQALETVKQETAIEKEMLKFKYEKDVAMYQISMDQWATEQAAMVDEQTTLMSLELKKAAVERKLQLDNQASNLMMDYSMKKAQEEMMMKQYQFQQQYANYPTTAGTGPTAATGYPTTTAAGYPTTGYPTTGYPTPGYPTSTTGYPTSTTGYPTGATGYPTGATGATTAHGHHATHGKPTHHGLSGHI